MLLWAIVTISTAGRLGDQAPEQLPPTAVAAAQMGSAYPEVERPPTGSALTRQIARTITRADSIPRRVYEAARRRARRERIQERMERRELRQKRMERERRRAERAAAEAAAAEAVAAEQAPTPVPSGSITGIIGAAATEFGLDPGYLVSVAQCESGLDPGAVSSAGYYGLFQFDEPTWSAYGYGSIYEPVAQARTAARLLAAGQSDRWPNCA